MGKKTGGGSRISEKARFGFALAKIDAELTGEKATREDLEIKIWAAFQHKNEFANINHDMVRLLEDYHDSSWRIGALKKKKCKIMGLE